MRTAKSLLTFIISILFMFSSAYAAKLAIVKSDLAIVYSDAELNSAIGTIKKGTRLKIGERLRKRGTVAYTELQEKLVYIKASNLLIQGNENIALEDNSRFKSQALLKIEEELMIPEHYITASAGVSTPGQNWKKLANEIGTDPDQEFYFAEVQVDYFFSSKKVALMTGFGYVENRDPNLKLSMTTFFSKLHIVPINLRYATLHLSGGVIGSPWMVIETEAGQYFTKGNSIGATAGGELRFFPGKKFTLGVGANYQQQRVYGHENIQKPGQYRNLVSFTELTETRTYANFSMKF